MRVVRCFAFLDLCGFTAHTARRGDADAVAVLAQLRAVLRAEAEQRGVRVTKWLGDGAMLSGVDATAVMACAVNVRDEIEANGVLALRGGVCAGPVIMFEGDDYIGAAVNTAARLCEAADAGQILAEARTAALAGDGIALKLLPPVLVPGLATALDVRALASAAAPPSAEAI